MGWGRVGRGGIGLLLAFGLSACGGGSKSQGGTVENPPPVVPPPVTPPVTPPIPPPPPPPPPVDPPIVRGDFAFYGPAQGLPATIWDVSADEGGNAYVAAGDAVLAKARGDRDFKRFDPAAAGLTPSCDEARTLTCPATAVAGRDAGRAVIGYEGAGKNDDDADPLWMRRSGGLDLVRFDGTSLTKERHVEIGSPPHTNCYDWRPDGSCHPLDQVWQEGRFKVRSVHRLVVNHDRSRALSYGDVMVSGEHGTISILVAHPEDRRWPDLIKGATGYDDTYGVFEHEHPANSIGGLFLTGEGWALAIDPTRNVPWFANQFALSSLPEYATRRAPVANEPGSNIWWGSMEPGRPFIQIWQPESSATDERLRDNVRSISFCDDGTMWVASYNHGLARLSPGASAFEKIAVPGGGATAVACDPSDGSVWVGFSWGGGFGRLKGGAWQPLIEWTDVPPAGRGTVMSIQIDRWSTPRVVYMAHRADGASPGGVTAYSGP